MDNFVDKFNKALNFHRNNKLKLALKIYLQLFKIEKKNLNLLYLIGTCYLQIKKPNLSIYYFEQATKIEKDHLPTLNNLASAYYELNNFQKSINIFERLIKKNQSDKNIKNNLANCYSQLRKYEEAIELYKEIIEEDSNDFMAYNNIGNVYKNLNNYEEALKNYQISLKINNKFALAYNNLGELLCDLGKYEDGLKMYEQASLIDSEYKNVTGKIIHTKQKICDWKNYENLKTKILSDIKNFKLVNPFITLSLIDDPKLQKICSENFINKKFQSTEFIKNEKKSINKRPKIAYFSSDFKNHPVLHLTLDIFKNHNKSKFEIFAFSLSKNKKDEWNQDIEKYFSNFYYVYDKSDKEIAEIAKKIGIDIAIDLNGFTKEGRQGIFFNRCAPIQINYLGYPGTMGAKFYDYIIADKTIIPESKKNNFTEKVIYQKNCYQPNINSRTISNKIFKKSDFNLPENKFIYSNFNSNYKITPEIFKVWMQILKAVPESIFWIYCDNETIEKNLKNEAILNGVNKKRIIFAGRLEIKEHLKRIRLADICLDTFPYGAHTSASDSIRMGLPLITIQGESFVSRVSSSILNQVNLNELVTTNIQDYKNLAIKVAKNKDYLDNLNKNLLDSLKKTSLFDSIMFTKNLEDIYTELLNNYEKN